MGLKPNLTLAVLATAEAPALPLAAGWADAAAGELTAGLTLVAALAGAALLAAWEAAGAPPHAARTTPITVIPSEARNLPRSTLNCPTGKILRRLRHLRMTSEFRIIATAPWRPGARLRPSIAA